MKHWHNLEIDAVRSETSTELITPKIRTNYQLTHGKIDLLLQKKHQNGKSFFHTSMTH